MTRIRRDNNRRIVPATSDDATPAPKAGTRKQTSRSGPVTSNLPATSPQQPTCCNMVLPKSGICPICSD
jgi:hypothetical protein